MRQGEDFDQNGPSHHRSMQLYKHLQKRRHSLWAAESPELEVREPAGEATQELVQELEQMS